MHERNNTAKRGGAPDEPAGRQRRKLQSTDGVPVPKPRGAAKTVREGARNRQIYVKSRQGRDAESLAAEFGLKPRRVYQIIKECSEGSIAGLELNKPWRAQRFADEMLLQLDTAINDSVEREEDAIASGNASVALGRFKARLQLMKERKVILQETGRLPGPGQLKLDAEVGEFWDAVGILFDERRVPRDALVEIGRALGMTVGIDDREPTVAPVSPPQHWLPNREERAAAGKQQLADKLRSAAEDKLLEAGRQRTIEANDQAAGEWLKARRRDAAEQKRRGREEDRQKRDGTMTILECPSCGSRNRFWPAVTGLPHCGSCKAPMPWIVSADDSSFETMTGATVPVIVAFSAPSSKPCELMAPMLSDLAVELAGSVKLVKVDAKKNPGLAARFQVTDVPVQVIMRDGQEIDRVNGVIPQERMAERLAAA